MDWFSFIKGLVCLVVAVEYFFTGISCALIPPINFTDDNSKRALACLITRGSAVFSVLYFTIMIIVAMYYGFYDGFILSLSLIALMVLAYLIVSLAKKGEKVQDDDRYFGILFFLFQALLLIKLSHTSYFIIDNRIYYQLPNSKIKDSVLTASLILELLQLLFWTLTPFLWFPGSKRYITIWGYEYADVVSHVVVLITYLHQSNVSQWDSVLIAYFVFYIINIFTWVIPLTLVCQTSSSQKMAPAIHCIVVDIITDIPMFITTMVKRTYINNIYICLDIAVKFIVFIRSVVWVPYLLHHDNEHGDEIHQNNQANQGAYQYGRAW